MGKCAHAGMMAAAFQKKMYYNKKCRMYKTNMCISL